MASQPTLEDVYADAQRDLASAKQSGESALIWAFRHARAVGLLRELEHQVRRLETMSFDARCAGRNDEADSNAMLARTQQTYVANQAAIAQACANVMELASRGVKLEAKQNTRSSAPQQPKRAA